MKQIRTQIYFCGHIMRISTANNETMKTLPVNKTFKLYLAIPGLHLLIVPSGYSILQLSLPRQI